ncbi:MAG: chemotaxis protein CheW [Deltaproteobacteria bacterium]|nr:chemotaxis protein CheW [Deltaproteobacteria bacterium]
MKRENQVLDMGVPDGESEDTLSEKYMTFRLGDDDFGLEIRDVAEIIGVQKITPIPDVPPYIKGVINLRGKVVAVMDMRMRLNLPHIEYDPRTCIIVINHSGFNTGLIVDRVSEVVRIADDQIQYTKKNNTVMAHDFIKGMGRSGERVKVILDVDKLLAPPKKSSQGGVN